jgi:hypothetical protein
MHGLHFLEESFEAKIERFVYTFEYMLKYKLEYIFVFCVRMKNIVLRSCNYFCIRSGEFVYNIFGLVSNEVF